MAIFFYKGLTRNLEIRISPSEFFLISGDYDELGIPHLVDMSLMKCYWMLQNARVTIQGYNFYRFWVIQGKQTGGKIPRSNRFKSVLIVNKSNIISKNDEDFQMERRLVP